jgi:dolichyl-phosphate beta-glucosyltransferase
MTGQPVYRSDLKSILVFAGDGGDGKKGCAIACLPPQCGAVRAAIVVPCYNEEHRLDRQAFLDFEVPGMELTFWFVNDGSSDGTRRVLNELASTRPDKVRVVDLPRNGGKAEAVRQGVVAAAGTRPDVFGFWDADLATPLSELPGMLDDFISRPSTDLVFASRVRLLGRNIHRRAARHYIGRVGATLISTTLGIPVYDTQCGAKLFRLSPEIISLFNRPFLSRWIFDVEIIARLIELRGREAAASAIYEHPLQTWHDVRGSKVRSHDFIRALRDLWRIRSAYRLG